MRRQEEDNNAETFCEKCGRFVKTANYLIHDARCKGEEVSESRIIMSQQRNRSSKIFSNRSASQNKQEQFDEERIPCPFCGYGQTFAELDSHPKNCEHRDQQCQGCKTRYPISLIQQHYMVCPAMRRQQQPRPQRLPNMFDLSPSRSRSSRQSSQDMSQGPGHHHPLIQMLGMMRDSRNSRTQSLGLLINLLAGIEMQNEDQGLRQEQIKSFPVLKYRKKGEQPDLCTICYCQFEQNEQAMNLPCKHIYHPECIAKWLEKNHKCPVCKQSVRGEEEEESQENPRGAIFQWRM